MSQSAECSVRAKRVAGIKNINGVHMIPLQMHKIHPVLCCSQHLAASLQGALSCPAEPSTACNTLSRCFSTCLYAQCMPWVYTLDSTGARHALRKYQGQPAAKLANSQAFFNGALFAFNRELEEQQAMYVLHAIPCVAPF